MKRTGMEKLEAIGPKTMVVGIDIAKKVHWARCVNWRGIPIGKAIRFETNKAGFEHIVAEVERRRKQENMDEVVYGMEPMGPYWKALAWRLKSQGLQVVTVNTHHTKQAKELDDNSPTKNDKKDALIIARLVKDGRYYYPYLPEDVYGELRVCSNTRIMLVKKMNASKNRIIGILDEYFPEFASVFKKPLNGKASLHLQENRNHHLSCVENAQRVPASPCAGACAQTATRACRVKHDGCKSYNSLLVKARARRVFSISPQL